VVIAKKSSEIPFPKLANNLRVILRPIANVRISIFGKPPHIYRKRRSARGCAPSFGLGSNPGNTGTLLTVFFLIVILMTPPFFRPSQLTRSSTAARPAATAQGRRRFWMASRARSSRPYTGVWMLEDAENVPFRPIFSHVQDAFQAGERGPHIVPLS
jgi:hypothetical protein